jgi:hypothetical protein
MSKQTVAKIRKEGSGCGDAEIEKWRVKGGLTERIYR